MINLSEYTKNGFTVQISEMRVGANTYNLCARENNIETSKVWTDWKEIPFSLKCAVRKNAISSQYAEKYFDLIN
jgi:hypothetical protein